MVVAVVTPVVFCAKATEKMQLKKLKLVVCKQYLHTINYIATHITIHVTLIVVQPKPKL